MRKKLNYPLATVTEFWYTDVAFHGGRRTTRTKKGQREMSEIGNWIVTADIDGLTYAFKVFGCTAQEAVFFLRRKYSNAENVKVEKSIINGDRAVA